MIAHIGKIFGAAISIGGRLISTLAYNGKIIWQAISKYWRRKDKWKRNQKW